MEPPKREVRFDMPVEFPTLVRIKDNKEVAIMVQVDWKSIYTVRAVADMSEWVNQDQKCLLKLTNGETLVVLMPYKVVSWLKVKYNEWKMTQKKTLMSIFKPTMN